MYRWAAIAFPPRSIPQPTPLELMAFIQQLRELSGGKPVGFKLCVGRKHEFLAIVKAMLTSGITPDFIVVDGKRGRHRRGAIGVHRSYGYATAGGPFFRAFRAGGGRIA